MSIKLAKRNDQMLTLPRLRNGLNETEFRNAAMVKVYLYDLKGEPVQDIQGLVLNYVSGSEGTYRGRIEETFDPPIGSYKLVVKAEENGDNYEKSYAVTVVAP